jgi:hypothetical protein
MVKKAKRVAELPKVAPKDETFDKPNIPQDILDCFNAYGFDQKQINLDWAIKTRSATEWYAILFRHPTTGELTAVDFRHELDFDTKEWHWEVQNDLIDGFDTVRDFTHGKLERYFL